MKTLKDYVLSAKPQIKELNEIKPGFVGFIGYRPLIVHSILERTAVVHPLGHPNNRFLVKLEALRVSGETIEWIPKTTNLAA